MTTALSDWSTSASGSTAAAAPILSNWSPTVTATTAAPAPTLSAWTGSVTATTGGGAAVTGRHLAHPFWTTPLPSNTALASTSANFVSRLVYQSQMGPNSSPVAFPYGPPYNFSMNSDYFMPVYVMPAGSARTTVWARDTGKTNWQSTLDSTRVPVPNPALLAGGTIAPNGTDGSVIIIDAGTRQLWEFWQFGPADSNTPVGYNWVCQQGGYMADYTTHPGWWSGSAAFGGGFGVRVLGYDWGVSASGCSYAGGILTGEDYYGASINHPILMSLPITGGNPPLLLPATRYDEANFTYASSTTADPYRIPEGTRFRLPAGYDCAGYASAHGLASPGDNGSTAGVLTKILTAIRDYGLIITESAGALGFSVEHNKTYGTPYNAYSAAQAPNWGNFGVQVPWADMVQIAAPATDISTPMGG